MANWFTRLFTSSPATKNAGDTANFFAQINQSGAPRRGTAELIEAYRASPWLRAVVSKVGQHIASTPWMLFTTRQGRGRPSRSMRTLQTAGIHVRSKMLRQLKQAGELVEVEESPILNFMDRANLEMTGLQARRITQTYLDLAGDTGWVIERNGRGVPLEYWPIPPHWITKTPEKHGDPFEITMGGRRVICPADDFLWFRDPNPANPYGRGSGVGEALGDEIETDEYASKMIKAHFINRAKPDMIISVEGATTKNLQEAKRNFEDQNRGWARSGRTHWAGGKMSVHELNTKFKDMELNDLRAWERDIVVNVYGVPPEILGILDNSNRSTITESRKIFASEVLVPRLEFLRSELQEKLVNKFDERLVLDYVSPVPDDREFQLEMIRTVPWAFTRGELRELGGVSDRGQEDDVHLVPSGLSPMMAPQEPTAPSEARALNPKGVGKGMVYKATTDDVERIINELQPERIADQINPIWGQEAQEWGNTVLENLGLQPAFNMIRPDMIAHLQFVAGERIKLIDDTTREALKLSLSAGVEAGEGVRKLSDRVRNTMGNRKFEADRIARTEVLGTSNFTTLQAFEQSGVVEGKEWITTPDSRARVAHVELDAHIVGLGESFLSGGAETMYPGGFGIAALDINCRCTIAPVTDLQGAQRRAPEVQEKLWKAFDQRLVPWERSAEAAYKRGLSLQEEDLLAALENLER